MRFRLVEDKTLTISDNDYTANEYDIKQFFDGRSIKYKVKDNDQLDLDDTDDKDDEEKSLDKYKTEDPQLRRKFIAKFNTELATKTKDEDLDKLYDIFYRYNAGNGFAELMQSQGDKFIGKLDSLEVFANLLDNKRLSDNSLKQINADTNFFNESDKDIAFKLKTIALLDNEELRNKWFGKDNQLDTVQILTKNGSFISAKEMNDMLAEQESKVHKQERIENNEPDEQEKERIAKGDEIYKQAEEAEKEITQQNSAKEQEEQKNLANKEKAKAYRQDVKQRKKIDSQEEQKQLNKSQGYTGKDILSKILKKNGVSKPDKQSIYDYTKQLIKQSSMPSMSDSIIKLIDNGDFDDELESVLSQRYKSNLDKDSSNMFNRALIKAINNGIDKTANPDGNK